jgi:hypothetical protein
MSKNSIGGGNSQQLFLLIFISGILIGSLVRIVAFILPNRSVKFFIQKLLPDGAVA